MQPKHLVFASYEIHPITAGGCGVFIWHAINELLTTTDYKITLLLDIPKFECESFINQHKVNLPNHERLEVVCLSDRIPWEYLPMETFDNMFMFKSYIFYRVLESMLAIEHIDYIEFFDYVGIAYFSVNAKKYERKFKDTILGIRGHCTVDLMDLEQCQGDFDVQKVEMYEIEKKALQNADIVLVQTEGWKELYKTRYNINIDKIVVSEPPMDNSDFPIYQPNPNNNVLFYGRVFQLKGIDDYINAGVQYLLKHEDSDTKFYIVGYDGKTKTGESYTQYLKEQIPSKLRDRFIFTGKLSREEFKAVLDDVSLAIFPNYIESFCYSIHEIYEAGVPIIYREIPAFKGYFNQKIGCQKFQQGVLELVQCIETYFTAHNQAEKIDRPSVRGTQLLRDVYEEVIKINADKNISVSDEKELCVLKIGDAAPDMQWIEQYDVITLATDKQEGSILITFLGQRYWVKEEEVSRVIDGNVLLINDGIQVEQASIIKANTILNYSDANYVTLLQEKAETIRYNKADIRVENVVFNSMNIELILFKVDRTTLVDLFDFRYGQLGILELIKGNGYQLLESYKVIKELEEVECSVEEYIFYQYRQSIGEEWSPEKLYDYTEKNRVVGNKNEEIVNVESEKKLKTSYHKVKQYLYNKDSKVAYWLLDKLEVTKEYYKEKRN